MGSWSESCGFSGMEIGVGEVAYVGLLTKPKYAGGHGAMSLFEAATTLIRGTYDDYGRLSIDDDQAVLDVFNSQSGIGALAMGDEFSIDHLEGHTEIERFWIHGRAFYFLPAIKPEFPYFGTHRGGFKQHKIKNIGEGTQLRVDDIRQAYAEGVADFARRMKSFEDHKNPDMLMEEVLCLSRFTMTDIFGYSEARPNYSVAFQKAMKAGTENVEGLLEAYRRNCLLTFAAGELRKKIVPSESVGPQHAGDEALIQFGQFLVKASPERRKRWDE